MSTELDNRVLYDYLGMIGGKCVTFCLTTKGDFYSRDASGVCTPHPWYKNEKGKPWIRAKRKTFVSLVKQSIREGDFEP